MKRTGYTTGVFDLFHIGHLNIIKAAKKCCDRLIVGVTTDDLAEKRKGHRPIIPFEERVLEISYKAFPIFQEDRTPKIPNDAKVIDLVVSYLKHKLSEKMVFQGTLSDKMAAKLEQDYLFRAASTRSSQLMNSPNEMENAKNHLLSLVPRNVSFRHGHRFKGQDTL